MSGVPNMAELSQKVGATGPVYNVFVDNKYKIRVGPYPTRAQAEQILAGLKRKGFQGAFLVTETGTSSPSIPQPIPTPILPETAGRDFLIQLGAYTNPASFNPGAVASMGPIVDFRKNQFILKLLSGFRTEQEARSMLPRVQRSGFPDAFLVEVVDGKINRLR